MFEAVRQPSTWIALALLFAAFVASWHALRRYVFMAATPTTPRHRLYAALDMGIFVGLLTYVGRNGLVWSGVDALGTLIFALIFAAFWYAFSARLNQQKS